jgi:hypothetical protein
MLCCTSCCTILLKLYIHFFPHPSHFCSWKCLQHSALVFGINGTSLVVFLKEVSPYHTNYLFNMERDLMDCYRFDTWKKWVLSNMIGTSRTSSSLFTMSESCQPKFTWEALCCSFSSWVMWILYRWNLESSCEILRRHLLDVCEATTCCLAEHDALCWVTAVAHSGYSVVRTEQARSTNLFITLSQTWELSAYFKLALCVKDFCHAVEHQTRANNIFAPAQCTS